MTIPEWQQLAPDAAAREVHTRVRTLLSPAQQRAVVASLADEASLTAAFTNVARGAGYPLGGVPFFAKDLFDIPGTATRAGATFLPEARPAPRGASALIRTMRTAGLVTAGKTHLHEFAYGITGENPHFGDCEHPRFPGRTTGGSSSGSAAIVAAGIAPVALGTDTGGSIRVPAAFCGLFGFRLSPGDAWIRDAFPLAPSFDTAGWFTATAADMLAMLGTLLGREFSDRPLRGCYVELPGLDPDVAAACAAAAERHAPAADRMTADALRAGFANTLTAYNTIVAVEAWELHRQWAEAFGSRYDPVVRQRLRRAESITPADLAAARATAAELRVLWTKFFLTFDFLVLPATPTGALTKSECTLENRTRLLTLNAPASVGGLPVLTIPVPLPSGLTTGLQVVVNHPRSAVLGSVLAQAEEQARGVVV